MKINGIIAIACFLHGNFVQAMEQRASQGLIQ
jgi:hypothetical protein